MLELGLKVLISYLVGSLTGALIVGKLAGGIDIRKQGSGNAGGTNALRTQGKWFALRVILIDIGKGVLPPLLLPTLALPGVPLDPELSRTWLMLACASASVVGHCYPVWFGFAGGKGAATAVGALLGIAPALAVPGVLVWVFVLVTTGYVGLATMLAAVALPLWLLVSGLDGRIPLLVFLTGLALFIVFTHRANIRRLRAGNENRIEKAMLLRRRPR
ncbi:MAG: glycerol-3-phosphate 1-O-acyltransferase PlsY [Gammaproteobacteria bacterium]|jgi:glycerol-3-phosphate acyltransferase PlsY|nr:glycerol-3-phosphate 1-O-acyltransferase PlsY [Gammaproteobacteria bacterium]